jgi:PAS domain S-box-containing protein
VIFADREGAIRLWNRGAETMFGYSADEAMGQSLDLIVPERFRARHWEGYRQVMATGRATASGCWRCPRCGRTVSASPSSSRSRS